MELLKNIEWLISSLAECEKRDCCIDCPFSSFCKESFTIMYMLNDLRNLHYSIAKKENDWRE